MNDSGQHSDPASPEAESAGAERPDTVHITLVRHGETFQNRHRVVQGQDPTYGRLTPEGMRQASLLGEALAEAPFDAAYCSPLERAVLTLSLMLVPRAGERAVPLVFADDLREINQGHMHGRPHTEWKAAMAGVDPVRFTPPGGECWLDVQARVTRYFRETILPAGHRHVLIVAHGGVNRGLLASLTGLSMADAWRGAGVGCPQDNTCVNRLEVDREGRLLAATVNESLHLSGHFDYAGPGQRWHVADGRWELPGGPAPGSVRPGEFDPYG